MNPLKNTHICILLIVVFLLTGCGSAAKKTATLPPTATPVPPTATLPPTATSIPATVTNPPTSAQATPEYISADSILLGKTYNEWTISWWKYTLSLPSDQNPTSSNTKVDCAVQRDGDVSLIVISPNVGKTKTEPIQCQAAAGTTLFMPVATLVCTNLDADPLYGGNEGELRACVLKFTAKDIKASVDDVDAQDQIAIIWATPLFQFTLPENNDYKAAADTVGKAVADGIFLKVAPLSTGIHMIHVQAFLNYWNFTLETYVALTVTEK